jgi:chitin synthase
MDLGAIIQDAQSRVDVEMITEEADANALYDEATNNLKYRTPVIRAEDNRVLGAEKEQAAKDYYASVRTNVGYLSSFSLGAALADDVFAQVLLAWVISNVRHWRSSLKRRKNVVC